MSIGHYLAMASSSDKPDELVDNDRPMDKARSPVRSATASKGTAHRSPSPTQILKRAATTPIPSFSPSASTSPRSSREPSPVRVPNKPVIPAASRLSRSRKNSQDLSPHRQPNVLSPSIPTVPSAAAIQRALSATGTSTPQLFASATPDSLPDAPRTQKQTKGPGGSGLTIGVTPPRFKSPPPAGSSNRTPLHSPRKLEFPPLTPSIVVDLPTPNSASSVDADPDETEAMTRAGMRTPARAISGSNTLETVRESSLPATPAISAAVLQKGGKTADHEVPSTIEENPTEELFSKTAKIGPESGSESGGNKTANKKSNDDKKPPKTPTSTRVPPIQPKRSISQLNAAKPKTGTEGSVRNMTVETETVSSVPQVAVQGATGERGGLGRIDTTGSLRLKPSTETIRPKKERKKTVRKPASIHSGTGGSSRRFHHHHIYSRATISSEDICFQSTISPTPSYSPDSERGPPIWIDGQDSRGMAKAPRGAKYHESQPSTPYPSRRSSIVLTPFRLRIASSKADIFEAKVASAVDEVNSSDSDETFVYESNPPEPLSARPNRYHSRTPSATSMASQADLYGGRYRQDSHHSIAGKKSMKFSKNAHLINSGHSELGEYSQNNGTSGSGRASGGNTPHHHIGRYGRGAAGHTSLFDNESPFPNAAKPKRSGTSNGSRLSPRPLTPRTPHILRLPGTSGKLNVPMSYDLEGEGADDERTPLVNSVRSGRTRNSRRPANRQNEFGEYGSSGFCKRVTCCVFLATLVGLLIAAIVVALVLCSKPLMDVHIKDIQNVLVSEQELMLDLHVHAINPNLVAIQVSDLDVDIFARSKYTVPIGTSVEAREPLQLRARREHGDATMTDPTKSITDDSINGSPIYSSEGGIDEGNDPIEDPEGDGPPILLGQILDFDSPLIFDSSPFRHQSLSSIGEVRLAHPGNQTEKGSKQWEKVIQHSFNLTVKGVLRYSLPISSKIRWARIAGSIMVHPNPSVGDDGSIGLGDSSRFRLSGSGRSEVKEEADRMRTIKFSA